MPKPDAPPQSTSQTLSLEFLCRFIPNEFSGERDQLNSFISACTQAINLSSEENRYPLFRFICSRLTGRASEQICTDECDNWDELKDKLIEKYQDSVHFSQLVEDLGVCRQKHNESVSDFFYRLERLNSQVLAYLKLNTENKKLLAGRIETFNYITLNRFIHHSHPSISRMLRWKEFNDLNAAHSAAIMEEKALKISKDDKFCKICKENTHYSNECRFKISDTPKVYTTSLISNDKFCRYCKKPGHLLEDCYFRKRNNERRVRFSLEKENDKPIRSKNKHLNFVKDVSPKKQIGPSESVRDIKILLTNNDLNFINVFSENSKRKNSKFQFLIDTGSSINLIKGCKLSPKTNINSNEKIKILGINPNQPIETEGSCILPIRVGTRSIYQKFYILNRASNISYDGILGKEFLIDQEACIDYKNRTLSLKNLLEPIPLLFGKITYRNRIHLNAGMINLALIGIKNPEIKERIMVKYAQGRKRKKKRKS